jgi:hypothetical protein
VRRWPLLGRGALASATNTVVIDDGVVGELWPKQAKLFAVNAGEHHIRPEIPLLYSISNSGCLRRSRASRGAGVLAQLDGDRANRPASGHGPRQQEHEEVGP